MGRDWFQPGIDFYEIQQGSSVGSSSLAFWLVGVFVLGAMEVGTPPVTFGDFPLGEGGWSWARSKSRARASGVPDGGDLLYGGGIQAQVFVGEVLFHLFGAGGSDDGA
jgi:hypothetical protein